MSVVTVEKASALFATGLDTEPLQSLIDREEDWLANAAQFGIGQLVGERTQRVYRPAHSRQAIFLARPTDAIEVVDGATTLVSPDDVILIGRLRVEPASGRWIGPTVDITFTPSDRLQVESAILELIRLAISASPFAQESSEGGHSYSRPSDIQSQRERIARGVQPYRGPVSVRLSAPELVSDQGGQRGGW